MGRFFDEFGSQAFRNEAAVSQNFILPLLQNYLGYDKSEIIPERIYPARDINSGVKYSKGGTKSLNHRPDFVVCLDGDINNPKFIVDSKSPGEGIDDHRGQLLSYAISVGQNLLVMTNGVELKVYDVNNLLFHSENIVELQLKLDHLTSLLGRHNQALKSSSEIIRDFDFRDAVRTATNSQADQEQQRRKVLLADFQHYLQNLSTALTNWHLPTKHFEALNNLKLNKIDPNYLLSFRHHSIEGDRFSNEKKLIKLLEIEGDRTINIKVFVGETGTGKSCLLKFLTYRLAMNCLSNREARIPIFISLREIGLGNNLETLIEKTLTRNGYSCAAFQEFPRTNDIVFLLDAYDEIAEQFLSETFSAIEYLSSRYECFLSTRPNRIPDFKPSIIYDVLPISDVQVNEITRSYLGTRHYNFHRQIESNNLKIEAGNILLLLFLISLFEESSSLPATGSQVISAIINRVKKWHDSKRQQNRGLLWEAVNLFMAVLAYRTIEVGKVSIGRVEAESLLLSTLVELEKARKIFLGNTTAEIIIQLAETGLLIQNSDHLYFWHRLILNHFAAFGLNTEFSKDSSIVQRMAQDEKWHAVIIGLPSLVTSVTQIVQELKSNLWLSALCLRENSCCDVGEICRITSELKAQLGSIIPDVRRRAMYYLNCIEHSEVQKIFFDIIDDPLCASDLRMLALRYIGKTRSNDALELVYSYLDWNESAYLFGPSAQACIARALSYYGEKEHLQIVENWEKLNDYSMDEECNSIFSELRSQGKLTSKLTSALQELFIREYLGGRHAREKLRVLGGILAPLNDELFAVRVINSSLLGNTTDDLAKLDGICELLKENKSKQIAYFLKEKILKETSSYYVGDRLMEVINESECDLPKEIFLELIGHTNINVASKAIKGLDRFTFKDVKSELEKHLYGEQPQMQCWALKAMVDNGEIIHLIRNHQFPEHFYTPTAHTLLEVVRRFNLAEAMPIMDKIRVAMGKNYRYANEYCLAFELAGTFNFIGEKEKQLEIISWFFDGNNFLQSSDNIHFHLMRYLKHLDSSLHLPIAGCYFRAYFPFKKDDEFKSHVFLEAVEKLGQHALIPYVKEIAETLLQEIKKEDSNAKYQLERPMRTLASLVETSDEPWILERLDEMKFEGAFQFPQLRRAVECLAYAGSAKSLPYIKQIAQQLKNNELVLNVCQTAYEAICNREKISSDEGGLCQVL